MKKQNIAELFERKKRFQHELNEVLSHYMTEAELADVKQLIADYYAKKLTVEMDKLATQEGWTQETYDGWLKEHMRISYAQP